MSLDDDQLRRWENIVAEVHKTDVPLECIKKVLIKLHGGRQRTINVSNLLKQGFDIEDIGMLVNRALDELDEAVRDVDFIIDARKVAEILQPATDKLLEKLNK